MVSASTGARAASAQGRPGRCWVGSCSGCSSPRLCAPVSLGQVQPRSRSLNLSSLSLLGPRPLWAAPQRPPMEAGGSVPGGGGPHWGWWPKRGGAGASPTAARLWGEKCCPCGVVGNGEGVQHGEIGAGPGAFPSLLPPSHSSPVFALAGAMGRAGGHGTHGARAGSRECRVGLCSAGAAHRAGAEPGAPVPWRRGPMGPGRSQPSPAHPCWGWGRLCCAVSRQGPPRWSRQPVPPAPRWLLARRGEARHVPRSRALRHPAAGGRALTLAKRPLLAAVSVRNLHLCEGYAGPNGRYHPGFYCPRLTDPAGHRYCCRPGPHALKSCCSQLALEALTGVNLSSLAGPGLLR